MAENVWNKCPKCSSKLTNKVECGTCGIIFEKYFQAQAKKKLQEEQQAVNPTTSGNKTVYMILGFLAVVACSAAFYYVGRHEVPLSDKPAVVRQTPTPVDTQPVRKTVSNVKKVVVQHNGGKANKREFIRLARDATVQVKTPWGLGSGFFIGENSIITNKHVIEFNTDEFDKFKKKVERNQKILEYQRQRIDEAKSKMYRMPDGPSRRQLAIIIQEKEEELNGLLPKQQQEMKKLQELEQNINSDNVTVVMSDGTEVSVADVITSENHDLALLKVYSVTAPILRPESSGTVLEQGDTVYTIGSPLGLRDTVTSGVFSGYRKNTKTNEQYLQTDAAINPGNSGGPLIDSHGRVLGVNTMILNNTEGIGFAIPIRTVFSEFATSL